MAQKFLSTAKKEKQFNYKPEQTNSIEMRRRQISLLKRTPRIPGKFNSVPRTGTRLKKLIATGKKPLKKEKNKLV
jgi:hypothetical protein